MILIVNLNLAVDTIFDVDELQTGQVHRALSTRRQAGGKGVNAARVLKTLGERCTLAGFLGGGSGEFIATGLRSEGIASSCTQIENESRTCLILNDRSSRQQTVVNEPGAEIGDDEWLQFTRDYERLLTDSELIIITGSLPPGLPRDAYARLIRVADGQGKRVLLDSSSEALREGVRAAPFVVKVNGEEAGELLNEKIDGFAEAMEATDRLREMGARNVMITLGARGAVFNFGEVRCRFVPPTLQVENSVGSGDAVIAGLAAGLRRGLPADEAGKLAVAAGTANALHGMGRCSAGEIDEMLAGVTSHVEGTRN